MQRQFLTREDNITRRYYPLTLVAKMLNVSSSTIRFWSETYHIETDRDNNGARRYTANAFSKLKAVHFFRVRKGLTGHGIATEILLNGWPSPSLLEGMIEEFNRKSMKSAKW